MAYFNTYDLVCTQTSGNNNSPQTQNILVSALPGYNASSTLIVRRLSASKLTGTTGQTTTCTIAFNSIPCFCVTGTDFGNTVFEKTFVNYEHPFSNNSGTQIEVVTTQPQTEIVTVSMDYQFIPSSNAIFNNQTSLFLSFNISANVPTTLYTNTTSNTQYIKNFNVYFPNFGSSFPLILLRTHGANQSVIFSDQILYASSNYYSFFGCILAPGDILSSILIGTGSSVGNFNINLVDIETQP